MVGARMRLDRSVAAGSLLGCGPAALFADAPAELAPGVQGKSIVLSLTAVRSGPVFLQDVTQFRFGVCPAAQPALGPGQIVPGVQCVGSGDAAWECPLGFKDLAERLLSVGEPVLVADRPAMGVAQA